MRNPYFKENADPAVTISHSCSCKLPNPHSQFRPKILLALVARRGSGYSHHRTSMPFADLVSTSRPTYCFCDRHSDFRLLQDPDDLFHRKPLSLHGKILLLNFAGNSLPNWLRFSRTPHSNADYSSKWTREPAAFLVRNVTVRCPVTNLHQFVTSNPAIHQMCSAVSTCPPAVRNLVLMCMAQLVE